MSEYFNVVNASFNNNSPKLAGVIESNKLNVCFELDNATEEISYKRIYLNIKNDVILSPGEISYFTYTPESNFYFVVETYGSSDTKI